MSYVSKGHKAMIFVDSKAIALATNHTLSITANILEERTKDDGDAPAGEFDNYTWNATSDNIVGKNDAVGSNEQSMIDIIDTMLGLNKVELVSDAAIPTTGSVPNGGWSCDEVTDDYPVSKGEAYIENLNVTAGSTGYATASVSFKGQGTLS